MRKMIEYKTGQKINGIEVIKELHPKFNKDNKMIRMFSFKCYCGNLFDSYMHQIKSGGIKSCGCSLKSRNKNIVHGLKNSPLYSIWSGIKQRCYYEKSEGYKRYGAVGIKMCSRWKDSFKNFYDDMIHGYKPGLQIDRKDNSKGYDIDNCRWATTTDQANNTSKNIFITYNNQTKTIAQWSVVLGMNYFTLYGRIKKYGYTIEDAFTYPSRKHRTAA